MCDVSALAKYIFRPSPPRPANNPECRGRIYIGNDGNLWSSEQDSRGVFRWKKIQSLKKSPKKVKKSPKKVKKSPKKVKKSPKRKY
jgi:hypothetical protein